MQVIGPFGASFLMPNHPGSNILMICTGTGSAPMRAMTVAPAPPIGKFESGELMLFFGGRAAGRPGRLLLRLRPEGDGGGRGAGGCATSPPRPG